MISKLMLTYDESSGLVISILGGYTMDGNRLGYDPQKQQILVVGWW